MTRAERVLRAVSTPIRGVLIGSIRIYRATLSGWLGGQCRFHPTCSRYAEGAIRARGALVGSLFAVWRILRCNPFGRGGIDPAPLPAGRSPAHDAVIHAPFDPHTVRRAGR